MKRNRKPLSLRKLKTFWPAVIFFGKQSVATKIGALLCASAFGLVILDSVVIVMFTGSLVLVQMAGRPLWPALVEGDANHLTHFALEELPDLSEIENADEENPDGIDDDDYYHGPLLPIGYHVTLLGDPVHRLWVKTQKMNNIVSTSPSYIDEK